MSALPEIDRLETAVDQAIAMCGGDLRSAIKALILANEFFEIEADELRADAELWRASASTGYVRCRRDWTDEERGRWSEAELASAARVENYD
jgi:hypothetical protein